MTTRDGIHTSLWQDTSEKYEPRIASTLQNKFDVIIVGGGITGITTGLVLQELGLKCLVLEAQQLCFGTTGGTTAHINTLLDVPYTTLIKNFGQDNATYVAHAAIEALAFIRDTIEKHDIKCEFSQSQAFLFAQDEKQTKELKDIYSACKDVTLPVKYANDIPVPLEFTKAIAVPGQGKFHPLRYVFGLAEAFENIEGVILDRCRVTDVKEEGGVVMVESEKGIFQGSYAIYATHIPPTINILHLRCVPYRSYAMAIRLASGDYPMNLAYDMYDPYHYYRTQRIGANNYLIVGGKDHKTGHEPNTEAPFLTLESHIRTHFDVEAVTHRWSSQYYEPADGLPYIGHFPGHGKKILVATGFGGNGMTYGTIAAQVLKNIVLELKSDLVDLFSPSRIKPIAAFKNFAEHNIDVFKQIAGKIFSSPEASEFADLAPGEGKIFKIDDQSIGIYKDANGALHAVNASCTHMRCTVSWNLTEKSWDCPCHGARYSMDGRLLNGPALQDLEYTNLELVNAIKA
jgi:glycine/D-amino acid oxidase-like deaminating enzyme/nitrite reductase/ring-hydroxylating ferredoxin subunit